MAISFEPFYCFLKWSEIDFFQVFFKTVHHFSLVSLLKASIIRAVKLCRALFWENSNSVKIVVQMVTKWPEIVILQVFAKTVHFSSFLSLTVFNSLFVINFTWVQFKLLVMEET